ncbi:uncharacterized protein LOC129600651 [Paramacrobiotus metropolitanus]|uniref:uncharacterized protein LOC129600651 n=1 Tax=Paramacrobiotus metropolitanus TaxID=2943436 RepID=UPI00244579AF|nr:uncharacterized protein LOC129600651 [Paramacrobiotus metropolitanus]
MHHSVALTVLVFCLSGYGLVHCDDPSVNGNGNAGSSGQNDPSSLDIFGRFSTFSALFSALFANNGTSMTFNVIPKPSPGDQPNPSSPGDFCQATLIPNAGPFYPKTCTEIVFTVVTTGCPSYRAFYQMSGLPCAQMLGDGSVAFSPEKYGQCIVGPGIVYNGRVFGMDTETKSTFADYQITVDTTNLQNGCGGVPQEATTDSFPVPDPVISPAQDY